MADSVPAIELDHATVMAAGRPVLREVTFRIFASERVALLGPNGAGKSTLVQALSGDVHPLHRDDPPPIRVFGQTRWDLFELRSKLGVVTRVLEEWHRRDLTGRDVLLSGFFGSVGMHLEPTPQMREKALETARLLEVEPLLDATLNRLSTGEARRFLIGRALVHEPALLLFDEPYTGLDLKARSALERVIRKMAQRGHGIVLVTHALEEIVPEIDRVVVMRDGAVVADGPKHEVLVGPLLSHAFGADLEVTEKDGVYHARLKA